GTCPTHKYLSRERRIIDAHIEPEKLVLCISRDTFTFHQYSMAHILECFHILNLEHMCFVVDKIVIAFDHLCNGCEIKPLQQLDINHSAMDTRPGGDCHGECSLHTFNRFHGNRMAHAHSRAKVGVSNPFWCECFQERPYYRVTTRVPTGGDYRYSVLSPGNFIQ